MVAEGRIFSGSFLSSSVRAVRLFITLTHSIPITLHIALACTSFGFLLSSVAVTYKYQASLNIFQFVDTLPLTRLANEEIIP